LCLRARKIPLSECRDAHREHREHDGYPFHEHHDPPLSRSLLVRGRVQIALGQAEELWIAAVQRERLLVDLDALLLRDVHVDVEANRLVWRLKLHRASRCERRRDQCGGRAPGRTNCGHREFSSFSISRCSKICSSSAASVRSTALRTAPSNGPVKLNDSSIGCPSRKSGFAPRAFNVSRCWPP